MLSLAFSNRYEVLLETLLARLGDERPGPFGQREIIVPSAALRRSVELAVAGHEGVAANLRFSYLAQWLWSQIGKVIAVGEASPFAPAELAWRIFAQFGERGGAGWTTAHPRLARYLAGADAPMRFDLAARTARVLDHYLTYRPRWLAEWSAGRRIAGLADDARDDEAWQAELWRRLTAELGAHSEHPAATFFRAIEDAGVALPGALPQLPASVHVFCLPAMPPLYRDVLRALASWVEVRLYVLNPCREYWFEIVEPRRLAWLVGRQQDLYFETGNRLLGAWGRQTQAHVDLLFEGEGAPEVDDSLFVPAAGDTLLARLQNAVLDLVDPEPGSIAPAADDRSLEVHVCHSLTRELEVLQDRLLALFAASDAPRPDEIVVVMPDLEAAAPLIEAVFGTVPSARRIPWTITGLGHTRTNPVARTLDAALALAGSRFSASRAFELLQQAPVAQRFGLDAADLGQVHEWLRDAGVRWGLDAGHRGRLGLPELDRHSFSDGLQRLFLAYALGDGGAVDGGEGDAVGGALFAGRVGAGNPEGGNAQVLGRLWRYVDTLQWLEVAAAQPHDADGWRALFVDLLDRLIPPTPEWADDLRDVRAAVAELHANIDAGGVRSALPLALVHRALTEVLDDPARGGVPGGAVTFSAMTALRGLPYRVVCVLGLDDGAFPGAAHAVEFDLMARLPARGDRQRRDDERNLFLDLMLAAREVLHLSYSGRSVRDNSEKPPSVLVDELLDYAARAAASDARDPASLAAARRRLMVVHPLQAFSRRYFLADPEQDARLASFNTEYCEALRRRGSSAGATPALAPGDPARSSGVGAERPSSAADDADDCDQPGDDDQPPFFSVPLPAPPAEWHSVSLERLIRFFRNPSRFLLRERLGLVLREGDEELADDEPFLPDWPGRQALADRLLPALLAGRDAGEVHALALAGGEFPAGALGERLLERELDVMAGFAARLRAAHRPAPLPPLPLRFAFDLGGEGWTLDAAFGDLRATGLVRQRYDDTRANDYLAGWITHLALCAGAPAGVDLATEWHSRDGIYRLRPCDSRDAAHAALAALVALYRDGLMRPLPFFPKSAWSWAVNNGSRSKAVQKWTGGGRAEFGERNDGAIRLAFRGRPDPLDDTFYATAAAVFSPLIAHLDDARL